MASTSIVTGAWPLVIVPRLQVVPEHEPCEGVIDWMVRAASKVSASCTFAASAMPLLLTWMR